MLTFIACCAANCCWAACLMKSGNWKFEPFPAVDWPGNHGNRLFCCKAAACESILWCKLWIGFRILLSKNNLKNPKTGPEIVHSGVFSKSEMHWCSIICCYVTECRYFSLSLVSTVFLFGSRFYIYLKFNYRKNAAQARRFVVPNFFLWKCEK